MLHGWNIKLLHDKHNITTHKAEDVNYPLKKS